MSCCFKDVAKAGAAAPDPTKHMRYTQGMVLGVEDFDQEFAYLSGRDRWIVRDLVGYGTARGLAVSWDTAATRLKVTAGVGVTPCGQLVCVPADQCADVNKWLAQNGEAVGKKFANAPIGSLTLHVVLSYQAVPTDAVPIPGDPCRSEDSLKQPSRLADDFLLELAFEPPGQREEDDLREFLRWLRAIPANAAASTKLEDFTAAIRAWKPGAAAATVTVKSTDADAYLRDALRVWVTELRPASYGRTCGCAPPKDEKEPGDRLLLASVRFDVERPVGQSWRVVKLVLQDESRRPLLLPLRAIQERILPATPLAPPGPGPAAGPAPVAAPAAEPAAAPEYRVVAAGTVRGDNAGGKPVMGGLRVVGCDFGKVTLSFDKYRWPNRKVQYVVKALAVSSAELRTPQVHFFGFTPEGFVLQVMQGAARVKVEALANLELMVEVIAFPIAP